MLSLGGTFATPTSNSTGAPIFLYKVSPMDPFLFYNRVLRYYCSGTLTGHIIISLDIANN